MSCRPGEVSSSTDRIGRRRLVSTWPPATSTTRKPWPSPTSTARPSPAGTHSVSPISPPCTVYRNGPAFQPPVLTFRPPGSSTWYDHETDGHNAHDGRLPAGRADAGGE